MNPKVFLRTGGIVLVTVGILGITGLFGRISSAGFFHPPYWINFFHLGFGLIILRISFSGRKNLFVPVTLAAAVMGTGLGGLGLLFGGLLADRFNLPELRDPSDHLAHLTVGLAAWWAWRCRKRAVSL